MKYLPLFLSLFITANLFSQKNVVPAGNSALTGLVLPAGTRQDNRIISTAAAKYLMDEKLKEAGKTCDGKIEVFYLPAASAGSAWNAITDNFSIKGYNLSPFPGDSKYSIAIADNKEYLIYYSEDKAETSLYISGVERVEAQTSDNSIIEPESQLPLTPSSDGKATIRDQQPVSEPEVPAAAKGFHFTTTNFDDGWIAVVQADYVIVTKGDVTVKLFYPVEITDQMRPPVSDISDYFWNAVVVPRYSIVQAFKYEAPLSYFSTYYVYGDAKDNETDQSRYIGMNAVVNSGVVSVVLASSASKQLYDATFPHPDSLKKMLGYNRFAISYDDLPGKWTASSGATAHYYNVYTGAYAGMQFAQGADEFLFNPDGSYSSKHSGAMGSVGNTKYYNQEYKGKAISGNWELSLTNRWKGAQDDFHAWFECVKGGRILNLVNKTATGIKYSLLRIE